MSSVSYEMNDTKNSSLIAFFLVLFLLRENTAVFMALNYEEIQFKWFYEITNRCSYMQSILFHY